LPQGDTKDFLEAPPLPFYFTPGHEQFRSSLRDFVSREITPFVAEWDEAGSFPRALYARVAELGVQGLGYPEAYGGTPADVFYQLVVAEEFARCGAGGVQASLGSRVPISSPPPCAPIPPARGQAASRCSSSTATRRA
jgi:acyl-CoA dehydrogenase